MACCFSDILGRLQKKSVLWDERADKSCMPIIVLGFQSLECLFGMGNHKKLDRQTVCAAVYCYHDLIM